MKGCFEFGLRALLDIIVVVVISETYYCRIFSFVLVVHVTSLR